MKKAKSVKVRFHYNKWLITVDSKTYAVPIDVVVAIIKTYKNMRSRAPEVKRRTKHRGFNVVLKWFNTSMKRVFRWLTR